MDHPDLFHVSYCAFSNLRRASRVVTQLYDEHLKPTGLKTTQCVLLAMIAKSGKSSVTELADVMLTDQTTMTRALEVLKKRNLVERIPDEKDQRRRLITLTAEGERILEMSMPLREQAQAKMIDGLSPEELIKVINLLSKMVTAVQET